MNIARPIRFSILFSLAVGVLLSGCQGIQGVRFHEDGLDKLVGEDGTAVHDAGFEVGMGHGGDSGGDGSIPAPHPRFHPLPTRPVFEPDGLSAAAHASEVEAAQPASPTVEQSASSVLTSKDKARVAMVSASTKTLLQEILPAQDPIALKQAESNEDHVTSRRKVEVDAVPEPDAKVTVEAPAFTPVKPNMPSSNDGWRPRVASP